MLPSVVSAAEAEKDVEDAGHTCEEAFCEENDGIRTQYARKLALMSRYVNTVAEQQAIKAGVNYEMDGEQASRYGTSPTKCDR